MMTEIQKRAYNAYKSAIDRGVVMADYEKALIELIDDQSAEIESLIAGQAD